MIGRRNWTWILQSGKNPSGSKADVVGQSSFGEVFHQTMFAETVTKFKSDQKKHTAKKKNCWQQNH